MNDQPKQTVIPMFPESGFLTRIVKRDDPGTNAQRFVRFEQTGRVPFAVQVEEAQLRYVLRELEKLS